MLEESSDRKPSQKKSSLKIKNSGNDKGYIMETKLRTKWRAMLSRAYNNKNDSYKNYGGRGISVCSEWKNDFKSFYIWAILNGYKDGLSIDRINNDGNYEPSNCRFVTQEIQHRNTRKIMSRNTSGYRGVNFKQDAKKYRAAIRVSKKDIHLGYFLSPLDAAKAYDRYVIENNLEHTTNGSYIAEYSLETK